MSYDTLLLGRPALPTRSHTQAVSDPMPPPTTSRSTELIDFCKSFTEDRTFEARVYLRIRKESVRSKKKPKTSQEQTKNKPRTNLEQANNKPTNPHQEQTRNKPKHFIKTEKTFAPL